MGGAQHETLCQIGRQKQADRAWQIFERSAEYSEFFAMGRDRLVIPGGVLDAAPTIEERPKEKDANPNGNGAGASPKPSSIGAGLF